MRIITYLLLIIVILFGVSFATLNANVVSINYYVGTRQLPLSVLLTIVFAIGCLVGIAACTWALVAAKLRCRRLRSKLNLAEKEIANLRAIPLLDSV